MWLLRFELRTSGRAVKALNRQTISPALMPILFYDKNILEYLFLLFIYIRGGGG